MLCLFLMILVLMSCFWLSCYSTASSTVSLQSRPLLFSAALFSRKMLRKCQSWQMNCLDFYDRCRFAVQSSYSTFQTTSCALLHELRGLLHMQRCMYVQKFEKFKAFLYVVCSAKSCTKSKDFIMYFSNLGCFVLFNIKVWVLLENQTKRFCRQVLHLTDNLICINDTF